MYQMSYLDYGYLPIEEYESRKPNRVDVSTITEAGLYLALLAIEGETARTIPVNVNDVKMQRLDLYIADITFMNLDLSEGPRIKGRFRESIMDAHTPKLMIKQKRILTGYLSDLGDMVPDDPSSIKEFSRIPAPTLA